MNNQKTLIGMTGYHQKPRTVESVFRLGQKHPNSDLYVCDGYGVTENRNWIAETALEGGYDYVFFIDHDIILPENALERLFECQQETNTLLSSGWYRLKTANESVSPAYYDTEKDSYNSYGMDQWMERVKQNNSPYFEGEANGMGCVLIDMNLFKQIDYPYFVYTMYTFGKLLAEDLYFFHTLRKKI